MRIGGTTVIQSIYDVSSGGKHTVQVVTTRDVLSCGEEASQCALNVT
jgi:hypothetical protein